ncbi:hypothetical protein Q73_00235 [Bacillus coahuilensis m2-6]|uniref:HTH marR-type domain-containing protein n=1 Tax=Bacillus coahuilensis p1.1.43 TaxID=1150625 RepID=A0A147KCL2_9BACI|nr:MarR family transcriptional regulator [Bacillus coahuilensis]KUP09400.1 hypothetical protein Q75_00270 [Bacillus coahuilensis p1.1.43]KUP10002.1 hypothetical protein Q73_00235 [Bacillus coahuilensis m2-6]
MEPISKWISTLHRYGNIYKERSFQAWGLGSGQLLYLFHLYKQDGVTQESLSQQVCIDKATTARAIGKLEQLGFVSRHQCRKDRRQNLVYLTDKAHELKPVIIEKMTLWNEVLTSGLSEEEKLLLVKLLDKMSSNATHHIKGEERQHHETDQA